MTSPLILACCLTMLGTPQPPATDGATANGGSATCPIEFFERLVARYRELASYRDLTSVVQITRDAPGSQTETQRTETQVICDILDGELRIITPGSQLRDTVRDTLGLNVRIATPVKVEEGIEGDRDQGIKAAAEGEVESETASLDSSTPSSVDAAALALRYRMWLAPHMALKFAEEPLAEFRPTSSDEGFTATDAAAVTIEDRVMVHVELKSGRASACPAPGAPDDFQAKFDLYVNPESMLIERIEGRERLADGSSIETTFTIKPIVATALEPMIEPATGCDEEPDVTIGQDGIEIDAAPANGSDVPQCVGGVTAGGTTESAFTEEPHSSPAAASAH